MRDHRVVLAIVGPGVGVAGIVGRHAVPVKIDPQAGVGENGVALDGVARGRIQHPYAVTLIEGDRVGQKRGASDLVRLGTVEDSHAVLGIAQGQRAGVIGADVVAGHHVRVGADVLDADAVAVISRDDVALGFVGYPVGVGADEVPLGAL